MVYLEKFLRLANVPEPGQVRGYVRFERGREEHVSAYDIARRFGRAMDVYDDMDLQDAALKHVGNMRGASRDEMIRHLAQHHKTPGGEWAGAGMEHLQALHDAGHPEMTAPQYHRVTEHDLFGGT